MLVPMVGLEVVADYWSQKVLLAAVLSVGFVQRHCCYSAVVVPLQERQMQKLRSLPPSVAQSQIQTSHQSFAEWTQTS